jgi:hypothetical protein
MSATEFISAKTTGAAGYTLVNDSYQTTTSSEQSEASCFNRKIKKNIPLYFSAGTSNNITEITCQFNDRLLTTTLEERCVTKADILKLFNIYPTNNEAPSKSSPPYKNKPFINSKYLSTENNQIMSITFPATLTKSTIEEIKEALKKLNILDLTNIETVEASIGENHETSNYPTFKQIKRIFRNTQTTDMHLFPYKKIMSLADGPNFVHSTSFRIKRATRDIGDDIQITSADLASTGRSRIYLNYNPNRLFTPKNIKKHFNIQIINLDNTRPFTSQLKKIVQKKYDLIVMDKGLCVCEEDFACGGIRASNKGSLYDLLTNVASILDTTKSHSLAVLAGENSDYNIKLWDGEIQQFNIANQGKLVAEAARNRAGIFKGITIKVVNPDNECEVVNPDSRRSKRCSIL